jgi:2-methylcitrate dehydratase PrpD
MDRDDPLEPLVQYISDATVEDLPPEAIRLAERCFVDTIGITVAGADQGAGLKAAEMGKTLGSDERGAASIIGHSWSATPPEAAFVNGTAGHGLDFDDVSEAMSNHPSVTTIPPLLAVGEQIGASGEDLLAAFVTGYETQYYLSAPINPTHYEAGWHATATLGTFSATATVANLLDLPADKTRHALNIAASMPGGLKRNFGTDTKPMHAGQAARCGVSAALLATEGFTANRDAFTGDKGFFDLYTRPGEPAKDAFPDVGEDLAFLSEGVNVKKYPCCYFIHTSIKSATDLREQHDLDSTDVESITVRASQGSHDALGHEDPETGLEAKFSMVYTVAAAIARGRIDLAVFDDENIDDPAVQRLRSRTSFELNPALPYASHEATVTVETKGGETHVRRVESPPGTADDPLSEAELENKFLMCVTRVVGADRAAEAYRACNTLRDRADIREVTALI